MMESANMSKVDISSVSTHHWLKHAEENFFHAYLRRRRGSSSMCGQSMVGEINAMDIAGDRSTCCNECFAKLYGIDLRSTPRGKV